VRDRTVARILEEAHRNRTDAVQHAALAHYRARLGRVEVSRNDRLERVRAQGYTHQRRVHQH
jgi:hypothetical protein